MNIDRSNVALICLTLQDEAGAKTDRKGIINKLDDLPNSIGIL